MNKVKESRKQRKGVVWQEPQQFLRKLRSAGNRRRRSQEQPEHEPDIVEIPYLRGLAEVRGGYRSRKLEWLAYGTLLVIGSLTLAFLWVNGFSFVNWIAATLLFDAVMYPALVWLYYLRLTQSMELEQRDAKHINTCTAFYRKRGWDREARTLSTIVTMAEHSGKHLQATSEDRGFLFSVIGTIVVTVIGAAAGAQFNTGNLHLPSLPRAVGPLVFVLHLAVCWTLVKRFETRAERYQTANADYVQIQAATFLRGKIAGRAETGLSSNLPAHNGLSVGHDGTHSNTHGY